MSRESSDRSGIGSESAARRTAADGRLGQLVDLLDVGLVLLDSDRRLDVVNRRAAEILSLPAADEEGWRRLIGRLSAPLDALEAGDSQEMHYELLWNGGEPFWVTFEIFSLEEAAAGGAEPCGYALLVRDRSALKALEADLAIAAQLRNLSRLYVGLAHDLRSPLNALVLNLELLKESLAEREGAGEGEDRLIETLEAELARLGEALDGLLSQTIVPGEESERFDLGELVVDLRTLLRAQARQEGDRVVAEPPGEPLPVEGNRDRIKYGLLNVAINSLEAIGADRGTIEIQARRRGDRAELAISDDGPGIPEEVRDRIFEMHFTTKQSGTGIGLFVARSAIEADGGRLRLERTGPEGTVFVAELPLAEE